MNLSILLALLPALVYGHMQLMSPYALNQQDNPNAKSGKIDYDYASPLDKAGADYPCKGHLSALAGAAGASVATWKAGSAQSFTVKGGASHMGGSCQASLSEDNGKNFRVMRSYIGGCPVPNKAFTFTVPKGAKSGPAVFAWTWFNNQGNREMYMNCASVTITDGGSGMGASYPDIFRANIGNGCTTQAGMDVVFPNPGNDVETTSAKLAPPVGNCGPAGPGPVETAAMSTVRTTVTNSPPYGPAGDAKAPKTMLPTKATSTMDAIPPSKAAEAKPAVSSGTSLTVDTSPAPTRSAQPPLESVGRATPSSVSAPRKGCSCVCGGYSFQFSPDELNANSPTNLPQK